MNKNKFGVDNEALRKELLAKYVAHNRRKNERIFVGEER